MDPGQSTIEKQKKKSRAYFFISVQLLIAMTLTWYLDAFFIYIFLGAAIWRNVPGTAGRAVSCAGATVKKRRLLNFLRISDGFGYGFVSSQKAQHRHHHEKNYNQKQADSQRREVSNKTDNGWTE